MGNFCKLQYIIAATLLIFQFTISPSMAISDTKNADESWLLSLKSSISDDPEGIIARNWSNATPFCSWIGIICSKRHHQRVTGLNISNMNLQGTIPPQLGNLSFLVSLNAINNRFHGSLPGEMAKLRRLKTIYLANNNFTGPIPSFFSSLPNLQDLDLSSNEFSGTIPASVANLSKLEYLVFSRNMLEGDTPRQVCDLLHLRLLNLDGNRLTGQIPPCVYNLTALRKIGFTENKLVGKLPEYICDNLPNLDGLHLSGNGLDGPIPMGLQKCHQLQILSLSANKFTGEIPREIGNLTRLTQLNLRGNDLKGQLPSEVGNLQQLKVLALDDCGLGGFLPESLFNISTLVMITLVNNSLTGNLPTNMGRAAPNLEAIYLGMNNFDGIIPDSLSNATKLTVLDLSNNRMSGHIPDWLGNFKRLQLLQLGQNNFTYPSSPALTFLTSLTKCRNLKELVVGWNPLTGKLPTSIGNFSASLQILSVYRCGITGEIPEEIGNLSGLGKLNLFDNELTGSIPASIKGLQKLQELYLHNNSLTGNFPEEICGLENLGALHLQFNQISGPLPECVGNMTYMRILYLDSNRFDSNIPAGIWRLNNLLRFTASSNMLSGDLSLEIGNLKAATLVDLSSNMLSGIIPTTVGGLESLLALDLADNRLQGPIPDTLGRILSLEALDLSHNNLTGEIPVSLVALLYLKYFNASFNNLTGEIPNGGPFVNFTSQSFMSNEALCGAPRFHVPPCQFSSPDRSRGSRKLFTALYSTLGVSSIIVISIVVLVLLKRRKARKDATHTQILDMATLQRIPYNQLQDATDGFSESNLLGTGGFSSVYKGRLKDGAVVAVKVFNLQLEGALKSFDTECEVLCSLRHRNLTKVISSCTNADFRALILEYMPNGSLERWLYSHNYFLDLLQRLNIVIDVGSALDYLHNGYVMPVVHCDLKPSNVLLDEEMVGHVSDFGISKIFSAEESMAQTKTMATIGYIAPEYGVEGLVSTRSDTYSFGILLMETFTRRRPSDDTFGEELSLRQWIKESIPSEITRVIDPNLLTNEEGNSDAKVKCALSVMEVAMRCTEESPDMRISMKEAVTTLNKIKLQFLASCGAKVE